MIDHEHAVAFTIDHEHSITILRTSVAVIWQIRDIGLGLWLEYRVRVWVRVCLINNYIDVHLYTSSNH